MSSDLRYNVNGRLVTRLEAIRFYTELAQTYPEPEKSAFLSMIANQFKIDQKMENGKSIFQTRVVPLIGLALLLLSVYFAFLTPNPSKYQSGVLWILLSVATAMSAVMLTGNIEFTYSTIVKAGGAIAIFCLMFFYVPTIYDKTDDVKANSLSLFLVASDSSSIEKIDVKFDPYSSKKITDYASETITSYTGLQSRPNTYTCYRRSDGKIYSTETCKDLDTSEIFIISNDLFFKYPNRRDAYLHYKPMMDSISKTNK